MRAGKSAFSNPSCAPAEVLQPEAWERVFGWKMIVLRDPEAGMPVPIPRRATVARATPDGAGELGPLALA